jgi:hypothetical protein
VADAASDEAVATTTPSTRSLWTGPEAVGEYFDHIARVGFPARAEDAHDAPS